MLNPALYRLFRAVLPYHVPYAIVLNNPFAVLIMPISWSN